MDAGERRKLMEALLSEIQIFKKRKENGQWLKSIKFRLPILEESIDVGLDKEKHVDIVGQLEKLEALPANGNYADGVGLIVALLCYLRKGFDCCFVAFEFKDVDVVRCFQKMKMKTENRDC